MAKAAEIKAWGCQLLELPEDTSVSVVELACRDKGCPDIETVIGLMEAGKRIRKIRIHMTMAGITYDVISDAVPVPSGPRFDAKP